MSEEGRIADGGQGVQLLTPEETADLLSNGETFEAPDIQAPPVSILVLNVGELYVDQFNSWAITKHGIFVNDGHWGPSQDTDEPPEIQDLLIPWSSILYVRYDFSALEEEFTKQAAQADSASAVAETPEEGPNDGSENGDSSSD